MLFDTGWTIASLAKPAVKRHIVVELTPYFNCIEMAKRCNDASGECPLNGLSFICPISKECSSVQPEDWDAIIRRESIPQNGINKACKAILGENFLDSFWSHG